MSTLSHSRTFIHHHVRTIQATAYKPEGNRAVRLDATYPAAATDVIHGVTIHDANMPGSIVASPVVAPIVAGTAYAKNARFVLTAAQAVNAGGKAGVYQVATAFTPVAATLTAAEAANVFYVGQELVGGMFVDEPSTTPDFGTKRSTYQKDIAVCIAGMVVIETGAAIVAGTLVGADTQGRAIPAAAGAYVLGVALDAVPTAGKYVRVELRLTNG